MKIATIRGKKSLSCPVLIPIFNTELEGLMQISKSLIVYCILFLAIFSLPAETVTISVIQNENAPAIASDMSHTIEDEILGSYFDAGQIVSNSDIRFDGVQFTEKNFGIKDAAQGFSDYLIAILLNYNPGEISDTEKKTSWAELDSLVWRVVRVSDSKILGEKSIDVKQIKVMDSDPYKQSRIVADQAVTDTLAVISKAKQVGGN